MKIPFEEITLHPGTSGHGALLFIWKGDLYRAPYALRQERFKKLCNAPIPLQLMVETEYTIDIPKITGLPYCNKSVNGSVPAQKGLPVYKHKTYDHMVRIYETVPIRAKDFISTICDINEYLVKQGYVLVDTHAGNIYDTIDGIVWTDWGSIWEIGKEEGRKNSDRKGLISALRMAARVIKWPKENKKFSFEKTWFINRDIKILSEVHPQLGKISKLSPRDPETWILLKNFINKMEISPAHSHWSNQYAKQVSYKNLSHTSRKGAPIVSLIDRVSYDTVTDVACNKGYFTTYAAKKSKSALGTDVDEGCIHKAIIGTKNLNLPLIFSRKDIRVICDNPKLEKTRYAGDLVLALAIVHHVKKFMEPNIFAQCLADLSKRHIIIEDVGGSTPLYQKIFINNGFKLIKRIPSWPNDRTVSLYTKKS